MKVRTRSVPHQYVEKVHEERPCKITSNIEMACLFTQSRAKEVAAKENIKIGWKRWEAV